jgi:hypothetical protein
MPSFAALVAALCTAASFAAAQVNAVRPAFPLKASADGRYLVDQQGRPFFYHADTAWCAVKKLTLEEFESYLDRRAADSADRPAGCYRQSLFCGDPTAAVA